MTRFRALIDKSFSDAAARLKGDQPEHSWAWAASLYCLNFILLLGIIFIAYARGWFLPVSHATGGLLNSTLLASLILLVIIVLIPLWGIKRMVPRQFGWNPSKLGAGLIGYGALYLIINAILLLGNILFQTPVWTPYWGEIGIVPALGLLIAQIFGNVLFEETLYRGYLLPLCIQKISPRTPRHPVLGINLGILLPAGLFALMHIPIRIAAGLVWWELVLNVLLLTGIGYLFSAVYLFTHNLFLTMAVHVLWNISFALFFPIFPTPLILIGILAIMGIWGLWRTKRTKIAELNA